MSHTPTVLLLVAHLLMSSTALVDRQWSPEDEKQHCLTQCNDECVECNVPITCDINEKKCGEESPKLHPDCPKDEICVPIHCSCKIRDISLGIFRDVIIFHNITLNVTKLS